MKSLKSRISTPVITMIVIIPMVIMVLFNVGARLYVNRQTALELSNVVNNIRSWSSEVLNEDEPFDGNIPRLTLIRNALQISRFSMNTEIVIVNDRDRVIFPRDYSDTFLSEALISRALENVDEENEVTRFRSGGRSYMFIYEELSSSPSNYRVLFLASAASADGLIRMMNFILIVILLVSTLIAIAVVLSVSKKISQSINDAVKAIDQVALGKWVSVDVYSDTVEIDALISGMNRMSGQLDKSEQMQRSFLQNASHELRTPLMSIQGFAEGLRQGIFVDSVDIGGRIADESVRLRDLVDQLLTLSRIQSGEFSADMRMLNVNGCIHDVLLKFEGLAAVANKQLIFDQALSDVMVLADENLLSMALSNLLSNALRYAKSTVSIQVKAVQNTVLVQVRDDGRGIDAADLPHVFERFYKGKHGHFGLGLAIVRSCMDLMKGEVVAYNDSGAVFEISLNNKK
jgi:two-component system, OmpR family, sensor histidine kinase CssS